MSHHVLARLLVCGDRQYNFRRRHGGIAPAGRVNNHPGGALALRLTEQSMRFHLLGMQTAGRAYNCSDSRWPHAANTLLTRERAPALSLARGPRD